MRGPLFRLLEQVHPFPVGRGDLRDRGFAAIQLERTSWRPAVAGSKNMVEGKPSELFTNEAGTFLPALVQRQVGPTRVLARVGPGRVPVPGEKKLWQVG